MVAIGSEKHQVGSTIKPILYGIFTNKGHGIDDLISTKKINLSLKSGLWSPRESHFVKEAEVTLLSALLQSLNRPVIRLAKGIGFLEIENDLKTYIKNLKLPLAQYPSQLLGAVEMSLSDLWNAYSLFIQNTCQNLLKGNEENIEFEDTILFKLANPNTTTIKNIVSSHLKGMRFFGKTGTTNNGLDNWYVFFDGIHLGVIWTGVEGVRTDLKLRLFGSTTSFVIYQNYLLGRGKRVNQLSCDAFSDISEKVTN